MAQNQSSFTLTKLERRVIKRLAKDAGLSFSNYVRWRLELPVLIHGGARRKKTEQPTEIQQGKLNGGTK